MKHAIEWSVQTLIMLSVAMGVVAPESWTAADIAIWGTLGLILSRMPNPPWLFRL